MKTALLITALLASSLAVAAEPLSFRAEAKVAVDASGKPTSIQVSEDLPLAVRGFIEKRVASWTFSPPRRGSLVADGVTYLRLGACAIPEAGGGYRLGVDFKSNGPKLETQSAPAYPAAAQRAGKEADLIAKLIIEPDGRAELQSIESSSGPLPRRDGFSEPIRDWVGTLHYLPEQLDGKPVATRLEIPITFSLGGDMRRQLKTQAQRSPECQLAASNGPEQEPLVMDSPIQVLPAG